MSIEKPDSHDSLVGTYGAVGLWSRVLTLKTDGSFEYESWNAGFSGGQSDTEWGSWRITDEGELELHTVKEEHDLDYGSASTNSTRAVDHRRSWKIVRDSTGRPEAVEFAFGVTREGDADVPAVLRLTRAR